MCISGASRGWFTPFIGLVVTSENSWHPSMHHYRHRMIISWNKWIRGQVCSIVPTNEHNSSPSRKPSPSVSGFVGSVVHPETLIKSCSMNEPKDSELVIPDHCCRVNPAPTVVTYH